MSHVLNGFMGVWRDGWMNEWIVIDTESLEYHWTDWLCFTVWHYAVSFYLGISLDSPVCKLFFFFFFHSWQKCQGEERHRFTGWMETRTWQRFSSFPLPTPSQNKSQQIGRVCEKQTTKLFFPVSPCSLRNWDAPSAGSHGGYDGWIYKSPSPLCFPLPNAGTIQSLLCPLALPTDTTTLGCQAQPSPSPGHLKSIHWKCAPTVER